MDFLFDIRRFRDLILKGLCSAGHEQDAHQLYLELNEARPMLIHTGEGQEAVIYQAAGYSIVATDRSGCQLPLGNDWLIAVYWGDISYEAEEVLLLDCEDLQPDFRG